MTPEETITVTARLFARARDVAGGPSLSVQVAAAARAEAVWQHLPAAVRQEIDPARTRLAINGAWARGDASLEEGDEVAFITPVSGGS